MPSFVASTENPVIVEVGVEFFLPTDNKDWIPNGFDMVQLLVNADELNDDRTTTLDVAAEKWCTSVGVTLSQVIESDLW